MIEIIQESFPVARKEYFNQAYEWVSQLDDVSGLHPKPTFSEMKLICSVVRMKEHKRIKKGEKYLKQVNKYEGEIYTYRASIELHKLCCKYDLFPEL